MTTTEQAYEQAYYCRECDGNDPICGQCKKPCKRKLQCWDDGCDRVHICSKKCSIKYASESWDMNNIEIGKMVE